MARKLVDRAFAYARRMHADQKDKAGRPFVLHLTRVWGRVVVTKGDEEVQAAALLHDILEDTEVTLDDLIDRFGFRVATIVLCLTRLPEVTETYQEYILRVAVNDAARLVKMADVMDHLAHRNDIPDTLVVRYEKAMAVLRIREGSKRPNLGPL